MPTRLCATAALPLLLTAATLPYLASVPAYGETNAGASKNKADASSLDEPESYPAEEADFHFTRWEIWHAQVLKEICKQFDKSHKFLDIEHLIAKCQVTFRVSHNGEISDVRLLQSSNQATFDTIVLTIIKSMNGNAVLKFPPHSERPFEIENVIFSWVYAQDLTYCEITETAPTGSFAMPGAVKQTAPTKTDLQF